MKRFYCSALILGFAFLSQAAWAEFSLDELHQVSKVALDEFTKQNAEHVQHFVGYTSWKSGEDAKVKVYVKHDGMDMQFQYLCHKHDDKMECHAQ